jgi:hypothetical protein
MLTQFRERYGRNVGLALMAVSCVGSLVYLVAMPVRGTITADRPGQAPLVEQSWSTGGLVLLVLMSVSLVLTLTATVLTLRNRPSRVQRLLLVGGLLAIPPSLVTAALILAACYLMGGARRSRG